MQEIRLRGDQGGGVINRSIARSSTSERRSKTLNGGVEGQECDVVAGFSVQIAIFNVLLYNVILRCQLRAYDTTRFTLYTFGVLSRARAQKRAHMA